MAVIDHISSQPSFIFPIEQIITYLKAKDIAVFIDGAHAINQVDINLAKLQPSAYFSNFHKWGFAPISAAFLYVSDSYLDVREY